MISAFEIDTAKGAKSQLDEIDLFDTEESPEIIKGVFGDYIETVFCRNKYDENNKEVVVIKVRSRDKQVLFMQYILDTNKELNWLKASKDAEVFFDDQTNFNVVDPDMGVINLKTKEVLLEYHVRRANLLASNKFSTEWANQLV